MGADWVLVPSLRQRTEWYFVLATGLAVIQQQTDLRQLVSKLRFITDRHYFMNKCFKCVSGGREHITPQKRQSVQSEINI